MSHRKAAWNFDSVIAAMALYVFEVAGCSEAWAY
jgi:hypothetical protein